MRQVLWETKNTNVKSKLIFCFVETTHEPMLLCKWKFGAVKDRGYFYKFNFNRCLFDKAFS
jgi:hypothetical protein